MVTGVGLLLVTNLVIATTPATHVVGPSVLQVTAVLVILLYKTSLDRESQVVWRLPDKTRNISVLLTFHVFRLRRLFHNSYI